MSSYKEHCEACEKELGNPFCVVHRWLDELFKYTPGDAFHRSYRHHKEGVEVIRERWGDEAAKAAIIHIQMDFPGLGGQIPSAKDYEDRWNYLVSNSDFMMAN